MPEIVGSAGNRPALVGEGIRLGHAMGGTPDLAKLLSASGMAAELAIAADALTAGLETGYFCAPLDHNVQLWQAIKTVVATCDGPVAVRDGLGKLADHVATSTLALATSFTFIGVLALIDLDTETATGLMRGINDKMIRDRAYSLWQEGGAIDGADKRDWLAAEREIRAMTPPFGSTPTRVSSGIGPAGIC